MSDYKQLTVRLPPLTVVTLHRLSERLGRPQWRVIVDAIEAFAVSEGEDAR